MNIVYNGNEFPVHKVLRTCEDYTDYLCKSASGVRMRFRKWADSMVEYKGSKRTVQVDAFECDECEDEGWIMSDTEDGEGHIMVGAGYPEKCICQFE